MNLKQIKELINELDNSSLTEINIEDKEQKINLKKEVKQEIIYNQAPTPIQTLEQVPQNNQNGLNQQNIEQETSEEEASKTINAPMVGTFYKSPSPDEEAYVQVGSQVSQGTTVCILEAMKLFNEIQSEVAGEITEILVEDGQMVEYGQPLFKVK